MSAFFLWKPTIKNNSTRIEFIVTNGTVTEGIPFCDDFYNYILDSCGIKEKSKEVIVRPYRSSFYSEYSDSDEWEDRWPCVWKISFLFNKQINVDWKINDQYIGIDKLFSCPMKYEESSSKYDALMVFYFEKEELLNDAEKMVLSKVNINDFTISKGKAFFGKKEFYRMELIIENCTIDFLNDDNWFEKLLKIIKKNKGYSHFENLEFI